MCWKVTFGPGAPSAPLSPGGPTLPGSPCSRDIPRESRQQGGSGATGSAGFCSQSGGAWLSRPLGRELRALTPCPGNSGHGHLPAESWCRVGAAQGLKRHFGGRLAGIWWLSQGVGGTRMSSVPGLGTGHGVGPPKMGTRGLERTDGLCEGPGLLTRGTRGLPAASVLPALG